jgi:hypothetical protein
MIRINLRTVLAAVAICLAAGLTGCASTLPTSSASPQVVEKLRATALAPARTGEFKLADGVDPGVDTSLGIRASTLNAPNGSFSAQLKDEITTELKAAGLYNDTSAIVISGRLTESSVDTGLPNGKGRLGAHFTVTRQGQQVFDKTIVATNTWESSFIGGIAIPAARTGYAALYHDLAGKLFDDPDFKAALKP